MDGTTWNANPILKEVSTKKKSRQIQAERRKAEVAAWFSLDSDEEGQDVVINEPIDEEEIFGESRIPKRHQNLDIEATTDLIRSINDPEHPHTLENLMVVSQKQIRIKGNLVEVEFTPTVPHCGMATIIGQHPTTRAQIKLTHIQDFVFECGFSEVYPIDSRSTLPLKRARIRARTQVRSSPEYTAKLKLLSEQTTQRQGARSGGTRESKPARSH